MPSPAGQGDMTSLEGLSAALKEVTDALGDMESAVEFGARAARDFGNQTVGFAANAAFKSAQRFGRDTAVQALSESVRIGGSAGERVTSSALSAAGSLPILGSVFGDVTQPLNAAAGRTLGITAMIAKAGGEVTPELRSSLFALNLQQEARAHAEAKAVDVLASSREVVGEALKGTDLGRMIDAMIKLEDTISKWIPFGGR